MFHNLSISYLNFHQEDKHPQAVIINKLSLLISVWNHSPTHLDVIDKYEYCLCVPVYIYIYIYIYDGIHKIMHEHIYTNTVTAVII